MIEVWNGVMCWGRFSNWASALACLPDECVDRMRWTICRVKNPRAIQLQVRDLRIKSA